MNRLRDDDDSVGRLLKAASPLAAPSGKARVHERLFGRQRAIRFGLPLFAAALAALVLLAWASLREKTEPAPQEAVAPKVAPAKVVSVVASAGADLDRTEHALTMRAGTVEVTAPGAYTVTARGIKVECEEASFRVSVASDGAVNVLVDEGEVVVRAPAGAVRLKAGEQWSHPEATSLEQLHREALLLEREGKPKRALQVLDRLRTDDGPWGELALYDEARILIDLNQPARAQPLLAEHLRRFPHGALAKEIAGLRLRLDH